ncbi:MAG: hypothetical protein H0U86_06670 [Chloroflexi bacterium]|nr:hypothetical protein [Chloroflexota bacterium]
MGKEIPGSWFESGDTERRTWDEMGLGEELHADDDDYIDDGITDEASTLDEWLAGWDEPTDLTLSRRLREELVERINDLELRIHYRRVAADAGGVVDDAADGRDRAKLGELTTFRDQLAPLVAEQRSADTETQEALENPPDRNPPAVKPGHHRLREAAISAELNASEWLHWQELLKGTNQTEIATKLGISQGGVSKRELKLRQRVDAISMRLTGRPYSATQIDRGQWARQGRRRNKSRPEQR